jgi:ribosomal protein S18 acetylase RimI-like enzyme
MNLSRSEAAGAREGSRRAAQVFRRAWPDDADQIASLHADSWRRHYRGAYSDSFLDGDVVTDRRSVWSARLEAPKRSVTILAEEDKRLVGFIHVVLDDDPKWGSLVDNLHVVQERRRIGIGGELLGRAAQAICGGATNRAMFLWVLQQNTAAQHFYLATGARCVEIAPVSPPGGDPARLNGAPNVLRMAWSDVTGLSAAR